MKLLHVYPALAAVSDAPRIKPEVIQVEGIGDVYVYRKVNVYLDTETRKTRFKESERNCYCVLLTDDVLTIIASRQCDDNEFRAMCAKPLEFGPHAGRTPLELFADMLQAHQEILADTEAYTVKASAEHAAERERVRLEREARDAEYAAQMAERKRRALETITNRWNNGDSIEWADFETLCSLHGVDIHPRTMGSCREHVTTIHKHGWMLSYSGHRASKPNPSPAIRALVAAMTPVEAEAVDPEVAKLFAA